MPWLREHKALFYERVHEIRIDDTGMTPRPRNALRLERILTLGDLTRCSLKQLRRFLNLGKNGIAEINEVLIKYQLTLPPDPPITRRPRGRSPSCWPALP